MQLTTKFGIGGTVLLAPALTGCAAQPADPLTELLDRAPVSADVLPERYLAHSDIIEDSVRYVGSDSTGVKYYVGILGVGIECLAIVPAEGDGALACGTAGEFTIDDIQSGLTAWLSSKPHAQVREADEQVGDVVFIAHW